MTAFLFAVLFAALPQLNAYLGKTLEDVIKDFKESKRSWEDGPGLRHYSFQKEDLDLTVTPVEGKIQRVKYQWKTSLKESEVIAVFQEGDRMWKEAEGISTMEKREVSGSERFQFFKKYVRDDGGGTAYFYRTGYNRRPFNLLIFTEAYSQAEADSIPRTVHFIDPRDRDHYQEKRLICGYHKDSLKLLGQFLETWASESKPRDPASLEISEVVSAAYAVFEDFYDPRRMKRITGIDKFSDLYEDYRFLLIQEVLTITVRGNFIEGDYAQYRDEPLLHITINDFRPDLRIEGARCLFLNDFYRKLLTEFLGDEQYDAGQGSVMSPAREAGESAKRLAYLSRKIKILKGHWRGWRLESHPFLSSIDFNRELDTAMVYFWVEYWGGEARYAKKDGIWRLEERKLNRIQ